MRKATTDAIRLARRRAAAEGRSESQLAEEICSVESSHKSKRRKILAAAYAGHGLTPNTCADTQKRRLPEPSPSHTSTTQPTSVLTGYSKRAGLLCEPSQAAPLRLAELSDGPNRTELLIQNEYLQMKLKQERSKQVCPCALSRPGDVALPIPIAYMSSLVRLCAALSCGRCNTAIGAMVSSKTLRPCSASGHQHLSMMRPKPTLRRSASF